MIFDTLENVKNYQGLGRVTEALNFLAQNDLSEAAVGRYEIDGDNIFYSVCENNTKEEDKGIAEAHKKYIDIQLVLKGVEQIGVAPLSTTPKVEVNSSEEKDFWLYQVGFERLTLTNGCFLVLYPNDLHAPGLAKGSSSPVKKIIVKVKV